MKAVGLALVVALSAAAAAQDVPSTRQPSVVYYPPEVKSIHRGQPGTVHLLFRVAAGYHVNSHHPRQEYLKKTELKLDAPTDIAILRTTYPRGEDRSFPFSPNEKLNVYGGDFSIAVVVRPLKTVVPARYAVHGTLKYQACDNAVCYPPKQIPVSFEIKVLKGAAGTSKRNPAQSPHVHR